MKNMKAYVLSLGDMWGNSNYAVMADTMATVSNPDAPHRMGHTPSSAILIDHPEAGWVLYDTGVMDDLSKLDAYTSILDLTIIKKPEKLTMTYQLGLLGLKPSDIKHVITSHTHFDHIGNDNLFAETANFYVSRADADFAYETVLKSPDPNNHGWYIKEDVLLTRKSVTYIDEDTELFKNVCVITLPGHTPCILGLVLHLKGGTLIAASDAVNEIRNWNGQVPGALYDSLGYSKSLEKLRRLKKMYNANVLFGHDENQMREIKLAPDFYE